MKELLKNKVIIIFSLFILGITYLDTTNVKQMEESSTDNHSSLTRYLCELRATTH
ncbi:MAG: hypothetical protein PHE54_03710 [Bacilli bacterium]|nr:hypothetical protein [Bacilli bacterium]